MRVYEINEADVESIDKAMDFIRDLIHARAFENHQTLVDARSVCESLRCIIPREISGRVVAPTWPTGGDAA